MLSELNCKALESLVQVDCQGCSRLQRMELDGCSALKYVSLDGCTAMEHVSWGACEPSQVTQRTASHNYTTISHDLDLALASTIHLFFNRCNGCSCAGNIACESPPLLGPR